MERTWTLRRPTYRITNGSKQRQTVGASLYKKCSRGRCTSGLHALQKFPNRASGKMKQKREEQKVVAFPKAVRRNNLRRILPAAQTKLLKKTHTHTHERGNVLDVQQLHNLHEEGSFMVGQNAGHHFFHIILLDPAQAWKEYENSQSHGEQRQDEAPT